jgi:integrase/recombinase XerD
MPDRKPKHLPFSDWPDDDRCTWLQAFGSENASLREATAHLAKPTRRALRNSYARWLGFLRDKTPDQFALSSSARLTRSNVAAFALDLGSYYSRLSTAETLRKLAITLSYLFPKLDWGWIRKNANRIAYRAPAKPRPTVDALTLFALGLRLMDDVDASLVSRDPEHKDVRQYRDGLLIALLAAVPLRRRNIASLRLGHSLVRIGQDWLITIPAEEVKTRQVLDFPIPPRLQPRVNRYLDSFRCLSTFHNQTDHVWLSRTGVLNVGGIYDAVAKRTAQRLGVRVNLHSFRRAAGLFWTQADRSGLRALKDLLGHSDFRMTEKHYMAANTRCAADHWHSMLEKQRRSLKQVS